jgi:cyclase
VEAARAYSDGGADEITLLDITATVEERQNRYEVLAAVAEAVTVPLTAGGGIASCVDIERAISAGAAAASISSAAFRDPDMVKDAVREFGANRIVIAIDVDTNPELPSGREVYIDGGRTATGKDAVEFAKQMADLGVGRILPTSKAADGTRDGYDIDIIRAIADETALPIIASGGAGKLEHFYQAAEEGHASGLLAASVFHFGTLTIRDVKLYLRERGIPVNLA